MEDHHGGYDARMNRYLRIAILWIAALGPAGVLAETVFVDDKLRVGVRDEPKSREAPIVVVTTGAELKVLEKDGGYLRIQTEDGIEGWVNGIYVTSEMPARMRLRQIRQEKEQLESEVERLRDSSSELVEENEHLNAKLADLMQENGVLHAKLSRFYEASGPKEAVVEEPDYTWAYVAGGMGILFLLGFASGLKFYHRRIERRLGGFRI